MENTKKRKKGKQITALLLAALLTFQNIEIGVANVVNGDTSIEAAVEAAEESEIVQIEEADIESEKETDDFDEINKKEWQEEQQETMAEEIAVEEMEIFLDENMEVQEDRIVKANSSGEVISGSCGENVTYVLDDEGVLTIRGSGNMRNYYTDNKASWYPYHSSIKKIIIDNGVTSIGNVAFYGCSSLTSVELPSSVMSIGTAAFKDCSSLTSVELPFGVTSIGNSAFYGCSSLTSVELPSSVTSIEGFAFYGCSSLTSVELPSGVRSIGENVFEDCSSLTSMELPSSVTSIESWAFRGCSSLTSVEFPSSVTSIGREAFKDCSSLTSVELPSSVTSIGREAFKDCSSLTSVKIPSSVTSIGESAFSGCNSLISVELPSSVTSIGHSAFSGCSSLTSLVLLSNVTSIEYNAFSGCSSLTSVELPSSVTSIGVSAFSGCSSLTSVELPSSVTSIGESAFSGCSSLTSVELPSSVKNIWESAFSGCSSLTSVKLPSSVTRISASAFSGCSSLTSVELPSSVTNVWDRAFFECDKLSIIKIINPDCYIYDSADIIPSNTVIYGYTGSTAQFYAKKYNRTFVSLDTEPEIPDDDNSISEFKIDASKTGTLNNKITISGTLIFSKTLGISSEMIQKEVDSITWTSSDSSIAEVTNCTGVNSFGNLETTLLVDITPYKMGKVTIKGKTLNGLTAECEVTVVTSVFDEKVVTLMYRSDGTVGESYDGSDSVNAEHDFYYSDAFFYSDNTKYNNSLAVMSLGLELTAFSSPKYDNQYTNQTTDNERAENIKKAYDALDFKNDVYYNYNTPLSDDSDKVAFSFATKRISDGQSEDTLIAVVIRGGGYGAEWASNFHIGNIGNAVGFDTAAKKVLTMLSAYVSTTDIVGDLKIWIVGYSRGAATANILAHYINSETNVVFKNILDYKNLYAYTFATPNGYREYTTNSVNDRNIMNIVSANDIVPRLALKQWGFSKYGQTFVLPEYTPSVIKSSFNNLTEETLSCGESDFVLDILISYLEVITGGPYLAPYLGTYFYCENLQSAIMYGLSSGCLDSSLSVSEIMYVVFKAIQIVYVENPDLFIYELDGIIAALLTGALTSWLGPLDIKYTHYPEHYLVWLESGADSVIDAHTFAREKTNHKNIEQKILLLFANTYNRYSFFCPVDVNVYNSDDILVASIIDNEIIVEELPCYVNDDKKVVYLIGDDTYKLELIGNNIGTMDYIVNEYNSSSQIVRSVYYYDVPLEKNLIYTDIVKNEILNEQEDYSITDGKLVTVPTFDTLTDDTTKYKITVENGVAVQLNAAKGESVSVISIVDEGYEFVRWTSNEDTNIFDDAIAQNTRFCMPGNDVVIKAVLKKIDDTQVEEYSILYNLNGGNIYANINPTVYTSNTETFTLNNPTREGYIFIGWTGSNGSVPQETVIIEKGNVGNLSYTANWKQDTSSEDNPDNSKEEYTISYDLNGGSFNTSGNPKSYTVDTETFILNNPTKEGYIFIGWTGSNGSVPQKTVIIEKGSTGNLLYTANWKQDTSSEDNPDNSKEEEYIISYDLNGGNFNISENPISYTSDTETFTLNNPTKEGYTFVGWTGSNGVTPQLIVIIEKGSTGNLSYIANWKQDTSSEDNSDVPEEKEYTILYDLNGGSFNTSENPKSYTSNTETFILNNPIKKGYIFIGWTGSNGSIPQETVIIGKGSTGNLSYTANWKQDTSSENNPNNSKEEYTISYNLDGGSFNTSVNPKSYTVDTETFTLNNPTKEGYIFIGWTGSNGSVPQKTVIIEKGSTGNLSYTANWKQNTSSEDNSDNSKEEYIISYDLDGGSFNTSGNPKSYTVDTETFILNNPIKEGYTFIGWTGSNGTTPQKNVTIEKGTTGNLSYTANWKRNTSSNNGSNSNNNLSSDDSDDDNNFLPINTTTSLSGKWIQDKIGWWYKNADSSYPANKWQFINGKWYFFDKAGYMATGWILSNNKWYYLDTNGAMLENSWVFYKNHWYFLKGGNGDMATGWILWKNQWYYLNQDGSMKTGWLFDRNIWYYLNENGDMAVNSTTPDGYLVDSNGAWISED